MDKKLVDIFKCPLTKKSLSLKGEIKKNGDIKEGYLYSDGKNKYRIFKGIPIFIIDDKLTEMEIETQKEYDIVSDSFYDNAVDWLFASFYENEDDVREKMIDLLELESDHRVLEIGCGTGRDSFRIARRLGAKGKFYFQDLSVSMVVKTKKILEAKKFNCELHSFASSARYLPFPSGYFDSVFHFGGFNNFPQPRETLKEIAQVTKKGGKVVFGDESLPPWLRDTEFGSIICTNNPLFKHELPLRYLPVNSHNVKLRWVIGGCFYLIDFVVGEGLPKINLDLPHKGKRGGTLRTRYYGQLEGVMPETKKLAYKAAEKCGLSLFEWLNKSIKKSALSDIKKK